MSETKMPGSAVDDTTLAFLEDAVAQGQQSIVKYLYGSGYQNARIDEVAVILPDANDLMNYVASAVMNPMVEHFNGAYDEVTTSPIPSVYMVRYDFLRILGAAYRVECMAILDGVSPLHGPMQLAGLHLGPVPQVVHVSFKVNDIQEYADVVSVLDSQLHVAQMCESTYGKFSYWPVPLGDRVMFLKPRVNTRDGVL